MKQGWTLIEIIVVMGIMMVLLALATPIFTAAKGATQLRVTESNLRQLYVQTSLYRVDYDGDGVYGDSFAMGLPPIRSARTLLPLLTSLHPPRAPHPITQIGSAYWVYFADPDLDGVTPTWATTTGARQDQALLFCDPFNNDPTLPLDRGGYITRLVVGIDLGGSIRRKRGTGDWMLRDWWFP